LDLRVIQEELKEHRNEAARATDALAERCESEKADLREAHDVAMAQLRRKMEKQRVDVQRLSTLLNET
jgi:hypothetical protein